MIRELLSTALAELDDKINGFLDRLSKFVGGAKFDGYAHTVEDAIRYARIDAELQLRSSGDDPNQSTFGGFIEIKQLNAEGSGSRCYDDAPGNVNQVTIGAVNVPVLFGPSLIRATIAALFTFQDQPFELMGLGGSFEMAPGEEINFEGFKITEFGVAMGFGRQEATWPRVVGALFRGSKRRSGSSSGGTCTLEPLELADPFVADLLGEAPFIGPYVYGEIWVPVLDYGCLLRVRAGAGAGAGGGFFIEDPTFIGKMLLRISGEAICFVTVEGDITLAGVKQKDVIKLKGRGRIKGEIDLLLITLKFSAEKTITIRAEDIKRGGIVMIERAYRRVRTFWERCNVLRLLRPLSSANGLRFLERRRLLRALLCSSQLYWESRRSIPLQMGSTGRSRHFSAVLWVLLAMLIPGLLPATAQKLDEIAFTVGTTITNQQGEEWVYVTWKTGDETRIARPQFRSRMKKKGPRHRPNHIQRFPWSPSRPNRSRSRPC